MLLDKPPFRRSETAAIAKIKGGAPRAKKESSVFCRVVKGKPNYSIVMPVISSSRAKTVTINSLRML